METATDSELIRVTVEWENGQVRWVSIPRDWKERTGPRTLLQELKRQVNAGLPVRTDWRVGLTLSHVHLTELRTFNALLVDALDEERTVSKEPVQRSGRRWEATWSLRGLLQLNCDEEWMCGSTRQELSERLTEAVQRPVMDNGSGPARDRLNRYLGRNL